ncbi:hypothetical protein QR680_015779 [Steinernema hermaphroditum]|uniref:G-protein coupled receptors family 1 profile domain-containing protein n=1 Tax=Steinernema hermaphroditum TaxID=289476 RepID=A0AA39LKT5_9BILA|nr:hypothetical protein QR680_015779 [Steinernema hermaphroditum]
MLTVNLGMDWERTEFILFFVEGFIVVALNIPIIIMILFSKRLSESQELVLIAGLCSADSVYALGYIAAGIKRTYMYAFGGADARDSQFDCFFSPHIVIFFVGYQFTAITTCFLSMDCFAAVFLPTQHCNVTRRSRYAAIAGALIFSISTYLATYLIFMQRRPETSVSALCFLAESVPIFVFDYLVGLRLILITVSVAVYIPIIWRMRNVLKNRSVRQQLIAKNRKFRKLTITVGIATLLALVLIVFPDILIFFNVAGLTKFHVLFYLIGLNKCLANIFVYTLRQAELRKAFWHYFCKVAHIKQSNSGWIYNTSVIRTVQIK